MNLETGNKLIVNFMGYIYHEQVDIDFSTIGGLYDRTDVYSKIPILVEKYPNQTYFKDEWNNVDRSLYFYGPLDYHKNWNKLMEVVEKIESLHDSSYLARIVSRRCIIYDTNIANQNDVWMGSGDGIIATSINQDSKLTATYNAVVQFIEWYNLKFA